ncbi:T9SS type A sorting domain-containing protein [Lacibacter luteus]|uniref:T9SS type A sorting domain-containing protein n=1 Tax=Lacibacter luteus TaxID=2508719 RepID=A0A4Q1CHV5_9BACT|nr:MopE-related protein [Lacibacter luteus]RXK59685.1 T9SS type A sorting domain-containing protein [Lacibacter luteus]
MYKAKTICPDFFFKQRLYVKPLLAILLIGSGIAAFAGLYANPGTNLFQFIETKSIFSVATDNATADTIGKLKATNITATGVTLSWEKSAATEKYTVTIYKKGVKIISSNTSSSTTNITGLEAATSYQWDVADMFGNSKSSMHSFTTTVSADVVNDGDAIGLLAEPGDPIGGECGSNPVYNYYIDKDGDGYGDVNATAISRCLQSVNGYSRNKLDCNDNNAAVKPGATEICDGIDNNCDGVTDGPDAQLITFYLDADEDGFGTSTVTSQSCTQPAGFVTNSADCNDSDPGVNPNAVEVCDGKDNDCDGQTDENLTAVWYRDADADGFGDPGIITNACSKPAGYVANDDDCDDGDSNINPQTIWYKDTDNDRYTDGTTIVSCTKPQVAIGQDAFGNPIFDNYVLRTQLIGPSLALDCNDNNVLDFPGATGSSCLVTCPATTIIYVKADATGSGNGSSWANALTKLQDALFQACPGITQIWVAKGTYYPDEGGGKSNNDRNASFTLKNNVAIYGGFAGTETQISQRNVLLNKTILSGDVDKNDGVNFSNNSGNSFHVIANINNALNNSALLDGFTVSGGNANSTSNIPANQKNGGGMLNIHASPTIKNCVFTANTTQYNGGGMFNEGGQPIITGCTFSANNALVNGAGIYNTGNENWKISNSRFIANANGGIYNLGDLYVVNTEFSRNTGTGFENGQVGVDKAYGKIVNCVFSLNGISLANNYSNIEIYNSISDKLFINNSGPDAENPLDPVYVFTVRYSLAPGIGGSNNNLSANPLFVDAANDNLQLQTGSPAIDAGLTSANTEPTDLANNARIIGTIDMGAYEFGSKPCPPGNILYVNKNATGANNGTSWADAYISLQDALGNTCSQVTQIWVAKGTYYPDEGAGVTNNNRSASFVMKNNIAVYGGFAGTETSLSQRNWNTNATVLSGDIDQNDAPSIATANLLSETSRSNNSYHVIRNSFTTDNPLTNTAVLDGFVITGGNASGTNPDNAGAGMYNSYASPVVKNCLFTRNAANGGGGIYNQYASSTIVQCIFTNNYATNLGAGINNFNVTAALTITGCTFNANTAYSGGGIGNAFATPVITNCIVFGNTTNFNTGIFDQSAASNTTYSIVESNSGVFPGTGNLNVNPLFVNAAAGNLRLQQTSPAINKGNDAANNESVDFDGNARVVDVIDMGAYEYIVQSGCSPVSVTSNSLTALQINGCGTAAIATVSFSYSTAATTLTQAQYNALNLPIEEGSCDIAKVTYTDVIDQNLSAEGKWVVIRTFTITDINSAKATVTQQITVEDNAAPTVITQNITVNLLPGGKVTITPQQVNNGSNSTCGIQSYSLSKTDFYCSNVGPNTVTLTVTGVNGKSATGTAVVTVADNVLPIVITKNITAQIGASGIVTIADRDVDNGSYDPCGLVSYELDKTSFNCSNIGSNTVTLTVKDANGNTASGTAIVTVEDKTAPIIITKNITVQLADNGTVTVADRDVDDGSYDPCGLVSYKLDRTDFSCLDLGDNTVTLTVKDANGNEASKTAIITVQGTGGRSWVIDNDGDGYYTNAVLFQCGVPSGYVLLTNQLPGDCNDNNAAINPATVWYKDADNDGYSDGATVTACTRPANYKLASELTATSGDCNDSDAAVHAGATWYLDADGDGYAASSVLSCTAMGTGYTKTVLPLGDCDDANAAINPATKWYIDVDNDGYPGQMSATQCTRPSFMYAPFLYSTGKLASELKSLTPDCNDMNAGSFPTTYYKDYDNDGFSDGTSAENCSFSPYPYYKLPSQLRSIQGDCDDNNAAINPQTIWLKDEDNDGFTDGTTKQQCTQPQYYKLASVFSGKPLDCDDNNASIDPQTTWYKDTDDDDYSDGTTRTQCQRPAGYKLSSELKAGLDCNDADNTINPQTVWYKDEDNDGYSDGTTKTQCTQPAGYKSAANLTATAGDCDDTNSVLNPATVWYEDRDGDGYPSGRTAAGCLSPKFYYGGIFELSKFTYGVLQSELISLTEDCDDASADNNPGVIWYKDADNDGFSDGTTQQGCYQPSGYKRQGTVAPGGDCNDEVAAINPTTKWYPDLDNDRYSTGNYIVQCTRPEGYKLPGELIAVTGDCNDNNAILNPNTLWYKDADNDGYTDFTTQRSCLRPTNYKLYTELTSTFASDCNDANAIINPATKWYKDADNDGYSDGTFKIQCVQPEGYKLTSALTAISGDCDDDNKLLTPVAEWYKDADNDGYSDNTWKIQCTQPDGYKLAVNLTATAGDCNDDNPVLNPATVWYRDADNDGYSSGDVLVQCTQPTLYKLAAELSSTFGDCNDVNASVNPGAAEVCRNGIDDNCNGQTDEGTCEPCKNATALRTTNITSTAATFEWSAAANPDQWQIQYKTTKKGSKWIDVFVTGNKRSVTIYGLQPNQNYSWQIQAKCGKSWTGYSTAIAFITEGTAGLVEAKTSVVTTTPNFEVITAPNPSDSYFTLTVKSSNTTDRILVRVVDGLGRIVEQKENVMAGTTVRFGDKYIPGIYFISVQQGSNLKTVKLIRR